MEIYPMILVRAGGLPFSAWQSLISAIPLDSGPELAALEAAALVQTSFDRVIADLPESDFRTAMYNARKAFFKKQKMPPQPLLATIESRQSEPLLGDLYRHLTQWKSTATWAQHFESQYEKCLAAEWAAIQRAAENPLFRRALLFASHDLLNRLPAFCAKANRDFDKKDRQIALSVFQYHCRSIFKTSPLGRFTTVQLWRLGQDTDPGFEIEKIAVTPNVAMLPALYEVLLQEPAFYRSLTVGLNPCVPATNHPETETRSWLYFDGEQEAFQQLQPNPAAEFIVEALLENDRKLPYPKLLSLLSEAIDAPEPQLETLLRELIAVGLLEWHLPEKGMTTSWCGNLLQYLSHLPSAPVLTDTAFLLQTLRVSARAIPFQAVEEARQTQQDSKQQLEAFFQKHNGIAPPIPAEQVYFEDVERPLPNNCPEAALRQFVGEISARWHSRDAHDLPSFRSRLHHFAKNSLEAGEVVDFQAFCKLFFEDNTPPKPASAPRYDGKMGAMIQVYREGDGFRAVVNALFPGGGKLYARWLHLFSADFRESLGRPLLFPWQGWSNANFQPVDTTQSLVVPDGRVGHTGLLLSDLGVVWGEEGIRLVDKTTGNTVLLTDLGLEAPESRPPAMQVLWHLGVPYVSSQALLAPNPPWESVSEWVNKRERIEAQSLVLARAAWELRPGFFAPILGSAQKPAERFRLLAKALASVGIPRYFFARRMEQRQKPQFFDRESAVSMLLFEKTVSAGGEGASAVYMEEMVPTPDQWFLGASGEYAGEFVVEFTGNRQEGVA